MTADVTTQLGRRLLESRTADEVDETVRYVEAAREITPEERQDVTRVKAALHRRTR